MEVTTLGHRAAGVVEVVADRTATLVQDGPSSFIHGVGVGGKRGARRNWFGNKCDRRGGGCHRRGSRSSVGDRWVSEALA